MSNESGLSTQPTEGDDVILRPNDSWALTVPNVRWVPSSPDRDEAKMLALSFSEGSIVGASAGMRGIISSGWKALLYLARLTVVPAHLESELPPDNGAAEIVEEGILAIATVVGPLAAYQWALLNYPEGAIHEGMDYTWVGRAGRLPVDPWMERPADADHLLDFKALPPSMQVVDNPGELAGVITNPEALWSESEQVRENLSRMPSGWRNSRELRHPLHGPYQDN